MNLKQEHYIFGLIGIGAVIVLYWLYKESGAAVPPSAQGLDLSAASQPASYPNAQPIQLGNVTINDGTAPPTQTSNVQLNGQQVPRVDVSGTPQSACGCEENTCDSAGAPVTTQTISQELLTQVSKNLASFTAKTQPPLSGVEAARAVLGAIPANVKTNAGGSLAA